MRWMSRTRSLHRCTLSIWPHWRYAALEYRYAVCAATTPTLARVDPAVPTPFPRYSRQALGSHESADSAAQKLAAGAPSGAPALAAGSKEAIPSAARVGLADLIAGASDLASAKASTLCIEDLGDPVRVICRELFVGFARFSAFSGGPLAGRRAARIANPVSALTAGESVRLLIPLRSVRAPLLSPRARSCAANAQDPRASAAAGVGLCARHLRQRGPRSVCCKAA